MFKRALFLGVTAGVLSGLASTIYAEVFYWANAYYVDFSSFVTTSMFFGASIFACILASVGFWLADKLLAKTGRIIFNFIFTLFSFVSILGAFSATLPLDLEFPEMFPSLVVPMHFFPALIWFTLQPVFIKSE
tara:strand:- start:304 stop:702 length:399 start_codon:yes stop_codon:yes gene_type:complete